MARKFSTLLLTGKAASLPFLMQQAQAYTPSYSDILTSEITQIQLPVANQVELDSLGSGSYGGSSSYGGAATLCSDSTVASQMSLVITGLNSGDEVFIATSTNTGGNESVHPDIKIGNQNLLVPISFKATLAGSSGAATAAVTVPLDLNTLRNNGYSLTQGNSFYLQTFVFPAGTLISSNPWAMAKFSELDTISVNRCVASTYGGSY